MKFVYSTRTTARLAHARGAIVCEAFHMQDLRDSLGRCDVAVCVLLMSQRKDRAPERLGNLPTVTQLGGGGNGKPACLLP